MSKKKSLKLTNGQIDSYSYNKSTIPFPEPKEERVKPPCTREETNCTNELFNKKELSLDEQAQEYMDNYRKAERVVVNNFYTGGGPYKKGILDAIYRGVNPLNA